MLKRIFILAIACLMFTAFGAQASITDDVKRTVDEIVRIVTDKELKKAPNEQKRRAALKKTISNIFDYQEMAKRSLETIDGSYAELKSKIITPKSDEFTLDYRLIKDADGRWMVYDVVIEGVSLVSNYRTEFNKIITAQGYPELVKRLQNKNNELKMQ